MSNHGEFLIYTYNICKLIDIVTQTVNVVITMVFNQLILKLESIFIDIDVF